jgi:hypothetical protein
MRKIFSILFALALVLGFSLVMAVPASSNANTYEALFTTYDQTLDGRFTPPGGLESYNATFHGGPSSGYLDGVYDFGLSTGPDYAGWNSDHTGTGAYDDPSRGWFYEFNNGGYTDAYSSTESTDSGYVELEWTLLNVASCTQGYVLTVTVDDLDDYVTKKGQSWASVPDKWGVYVNGAYIGDLYDYDDPVGSGPDRSINVFDVGYVSGSVKIEINGAYFDLLHNTAYYGTDYGDYASWGDTASAQHGIRLEGLKLAPRQGVATYPGTGTAYFTPSAGSITGLSAVAESSLPTTGKPALNFPHGFFSFTITGLGVGDTVTVTITLPPGAAPTQYWKYGPTPANHVDHWYQIPMTIVGPPNVIRITLTDGGLGDDDWTAEGVIVDQGAPGSGAVGWETFPINKVRVLLPWIALFAAIIIGASLLVLRRRRVQS